MYEGQERCIQSIFVGKPEEKRPLGRPRRRWKYNVKIYLQETRWGVDWIDVTQNMEKWLAVVKIVVKLQVLQNVGNLLIS
jgi:hypothetical protein